jgi:hypothetical protein
MSFEFDKPKTVNTNLTARVNCKTCNGDRMVVYSTRANVTTGWMAERGLAARGEVEEFAPCPDCNADCDTRRPNFHSPDPARTRERLAR